MAITELALSAFKSFPSTTIPMRPLTLLAGANHCGKSSIIQALRMFCNSRTEHNPFLSGHGGIDELRSQLAPPESTISIQCKFESGTSAKMEIMDHAWRAPDTVPFMLHVGADRLGPQVNLPLETRKAELPSLGARCQNVLDFIANLEPTLIPEKLHHTSSEGRTFAYEIRGWLTEVAASAKLIYEVERKRDLSHAKIDTYRATNAGFGISYSLPVFAAALGLAAHGPENDGTEWGPRWANGIRTGGALLLVENPESHVHSE